jgi:hypothetical protein
VGYGFLFPHREMKFNKETALFQARVYSVKDTAVVPAIVTRKYKSAQEFREFVKELPLNQHTYDDTFLISPKKVVSVYDFNEDSTIVFIGYSNPLFLKMKPESDFLNYKIRFGFVRRGDVKLLGE